MPAEEILVLFKALQMELSAKEALKIQSDWKLLVSFIVLLTMRQTVAHRNDTTQR